MESRLMMMDRQEYEERYGEEVGTCSIHKVTVVDRSCDQCYDEIDWTCVECEEWRADDARVEAGMKCGVCAYGSDSPSSSTFLYGWQEENR
jgi:hypothetical protein